MKIFTSADFEQGSEDWLMVRGTIPTASRFKDVLAKGQGKTRRTYMMTLIGQRVTGEVAESYSNHHMDRGHEMEFYARSQYEFTYDVEVDEASFILNASESAGYSPDGLIGENGCIEIKSKLPHLQCEILLQNKMPNEHIAQVQGGLWVSEREWCDFVSYWPGLPLFVKRIYRDEDYIKNLELEINLFNDEMIQLEQKIRNM